MPGSPLRHGHQLPVHCAGLHLQCAERVAGSCPVCRSGSRQGHAAHRTRRHAVGGRPDPEGLHEADRPGRQTVVRRGDDVQIRAKAKQQAATTGGIVIDTRARFGYTAAPGTTDDARLRHLTIALPPECAARLFAARDAGGTEQQLRDITAEGLQEICSRTAAAAPRACWWSSPTWSRWTSTCSGAHSAHAQGPPGPTPRAVEHRKLAVQ